MPTRQQIHRALDGCLAAGARRDRAGMQPVRPHGRWLLALVPSPPLLAAPAYRAAARSTSMPATGWPEDLADTAFAEAAGLCPRLARLPGRRHLPHPAARPGRPLCAPDRGAQLGRRAADGPLCRAVHRAHCLLPGAVAHARCSLVATAAVLAYQWFVIRDGTRDHRWRDGAAVVVIDALLSVAVGRVTADAASAG